MELEDLVGTTIDGRYRLEAMLGRGAFGAVFRAVQVGLDRPVAIKLLHSGPGAGPREIERFKVEARAASAIGHPGIVQIHDFGVGPGGSAYLAMELLGGETLGEAMTAGPLPPSRAVHIGHQVADAMAAVHAHKIIHRDLKPGNVHLLPGDRVRIIDFGIAKLIDATAMLTRPDEIMGTPFYMAPEQWESADVDARADVYSLGVMLFEMISGRPPFIVSNVTELVLKVCTEEPPDLRTFTAVDPALATLIGSCLRRFRSDRLQTMAELAESLRLLGADPAAVSDSSGLMDPADSTDPEVSGPQRPMPLQIDGAETPSADPPAHGTLLLDSQVRPGPPHPRASDDPTPPPALPTHRSIPLVAALFLGSILGALVLGIVAYGIGWNAPPGPQAEPAPAPEPSPAAELPSGLSPEAATQVSEARTVVLRSEPAGAEVVVAGEVIGSTPLELVVDDRPIVLRTRSGTERTVTVEEGADAVTVDLERTPRRPVKQPRRIERPQTPSSPMMVRPQHPDIQDPWGKP
ncbi:MAG: serine/threonine-protein kinase [Myxococcota bacterium]